jgi:diguanylate cyclase (GGDEF)-like protein
VANTGLGMVIKIDIAEIYTPIKEQMQKAALFILGLLIVGLWLIRKHLLPLVESIDSARAQAEQEKARFVVAAEGGFDSFYIFDAVRDQKNEIVDFRCTFINQRASEFIYRKPGEFVGKLLCEELPFARGPMHFDKLKYVIETGQPIFDELMIDDTQVQPSWISRQIVKLGDGAAVTTRDITKQKDTENHMRHVAMHDAMTGLPNRALYEDRAQVALEHAKRDQQQFAIALIDVDHFKRVNDTLGHYMGDILLKHLAVILTKNIRPSDTVGRLGGDEFALVLPNVSHPDGSTVVLDKIFKALEETIMVEGHELHISISVGISAYPDDGTDLATLLRHADEAMYDAKAAGRNNFQIYNNPKTLNLVRRES